MLVSGLLTDAAQMIARHITQLGAMAIMAWTAVRLLNGTLGHALVSAIGLEAPHPPAAVNDAVEHELRQLHERFDALEARLGSTAVSPPPDLTRLEAGHQAELLRTPH